ncbi:MAG: hypothetical protein R2865_08530 [Deinococcales bacterium]
MAGLESALSQHYLGGFMQSILKETRERMQKSIDAFGQNLSVVRTGRANPAIFNRVMVDYYGAMTP